MRIVEPVSLERRHDADVIIILLEICHFGSLVVVIVADIFKSDNTSKTYSLVKIVVILSIERANVMRAKLFAAAKHCSEHLAEVCWRNRLSRQYL